MRKVLTDNSTTNDEVRALAHAQQNEKMAYEAQQEEAHFEQTLEKELWENQLQREYQYRQENRLKRVAKI